MDKKIVKNAIYYAIKAMLSVVFPLITFPYVSRVLQVDNIGKYNFANSVVSYFLLFAGFGIATFAVREGAKYRNDKELMGRFASEVFSVNLITTIVSYFALAICTLLVPQFYEMKTLILVFSVTIFFTTIGTEWIFTIYEEYRYITIRKFIFQVISLILLFILVKNEDDYVKYAAITVFSSVGSELLNFFRARKLCKIKITTHFEFVTVSNFIKPLCIVFLSSLATTIFVNSDVILLGLINTNYDVGIYSAAVKVYNIVKALLSSIIIVSLPRLSYEYGRGIMNEYNKLFKEVMQMLCLIVCPCVVGIIMLRKEIVLFLSDSTYMSAEIPLSLLSISLFFSMFGWIYNQGALIIRKMDRQALIATSVAALSNIMLNILFLKYGSYNVAAITTIIAEMLNMLYCMFALRKNGIPMNFPIRELIQGFLASFTVIAACAVVKTVFDKTILVIAVSVIASAALYFVVQLLMGNSILRKFKEKLVGRLIKK